MGSAAGSRNSRGRPIVNMFPLQPGEKVNVVLPLTGRLQELSADHYVFMATAQGVVKKTALDEFSNPRKAGIIAVDLDPGDFLIGAALTDGQHDVMLFSDGGKAVVSWKTTCGRWGAMRAVCVACSWKRARA